MVEEYHYLFKVITLGNSGVGKTSLIYRFSDDIFIDSSKTTIFDFRIKDINIDGKIVRLQMWDTAGQERFRTLTRMYYVGSQGCIVVFDITDRSSFDEVSNWLGEINRYIEGSRSVIIVGAKADLEHQRQVSFNEAKAFADQNNMNYIEISSLSGQNVQDSFSLIAKAMIS